MKKIIVFLFAFSSFFVKAQTVPNFDQIKLEKATDYKPAEPFVLQTANYLLTSPVTKENAADRLNSLRFISKWMNGTPDHSYVFSDVADKIGHDNDILGLFMAAMAKYSLDNKAVAKDGKLVKLNALKIVLDYCEVKENKVRMTKQLKKLSEAREKGQLEEAFQ
jgi:hypothetical protein